MGSGALRLGCNLREKTPAPQARIACRLSLPRARRTGEARKSMQAQPAAACGDSMGSDTFYNKRRLLWEAVRFVWAVTGKRTAPRRRRELREGGPARFQARLPHSRGARFLWAVGTSYNEQALL